MDYEYNEDDRRCYPQRDEDYQSVESRHPFHDVSVAFHPSFSEEPDEEGDYIEDYQCNRHGIKLLLPMPR